MSGVSIIIGIARNLYRKRILSMIIKFVIQIIERDYLNSHLPGVLYNDCVLIMYNESLMYKLLKNTDSCNVHIMQ